MKTEKDYEELLRLFNKHKVKYCIVGAFALAFHARPRYTKDLDMLVEPSLVNGQRIASALKDFGFGSLDITPKDFSKKGGIIQLGYEPVRIDLLTEIEGCSFNEIWDNRRREIYGKEKVYFIGLEQLIKNKKHSGRRQDLADLELLQKAQKAQKLLEKPC